VDLANMMLCLALRSSPELVYERAKRQFTVEEITEGFAAARGLAVPSQLRHLLRAQGRDLHAEFVRLLPSPPRPIRIQRWSPRRVGLMAGTAFLAVVLLAMFLSTTNNDSAVKTSLEIQSLGCTDLEPLWVQAQAVPSASLVPCVRTLPVGWSVTNVAVNDGRSVITLAHDQTGGDAMVARLTAGCDVGQAAEQASGQPGVRRYQLVERQGSDFSAVGFDVFPGGCVTTRIRALASSKAEVTAAAPGILGFIPPPAARPGPRAALRRPAPARSLDEPPGPAKRAPPRGRNPTIQLVLLRTLPAGTVVRLHLYVR
jgi:hypothetical protein